MTQGEAGVQPSSRTLILPESGYAIYRSAWEDPNATYLFFSAANNSDYHKHADENSFVLSSGGLDLITEAGPHGYDSKDPFTNYGYSQFAHNTVVLDGTSIRRAGGTSDDVSMEVKAVDDSGFTVVGKNRRLVDGVHERTMDVVEVDGDPEISITDVVTCSTEREGAVLWHLGSQVRPVLHGHGFELFDGNRKVLGVHFEADTALQLDMLRGQRSPSYMGWQFPRFGEQVPGNVLRVRFRARQATIHASIRVDRFTDQAQGLLNTNERWRRRQDESTGVGLNYVLDHAKTERGKGTLVAAFSAHDQAGDFTGDYRSALEKAGVHVLYILDDFGDQGSYYLQDHGDRRIYQAVQNLIRATLTTLGLSGEDLITVGSSKGGTGALIHGSVPVRSTSLLLRHRPRSAHSWKNDTQTFCSS